MAGAIRILYVDDEPELLNIGKLFLEESGDFTITTALSATEGIRLLEQEKFDAIVSDYQMPGMDGIQFLVEVRSRLGPIPFILFTGRGREEVVIQAINSGADFYLQKGGEPGAQFAELTHKIKQAALRKRAEDSLAESERVHATMISNLPGFVYRCANDCDWTMEYISDGCREITGYSPDELLNNKLRTYNDLVHPEFQKSLWDKVQNFLEKKEVIEVEYPLITKSGETRWVWERGRGIYSEDGCLLYLEGFITDITGRKKAEDAIRMAEDTYRNIFLNSQIGLFRTDLRTGLLLDVNDTVARFIGYPDRTSLLAKPFNIVERYADAYDHEKIISLLQADGEFRNYDARFLKNDGSIIWMRFSGRLVKEKGWLEGVSEDITDRKLVEQALKESESFNRNLVENLPDYIGISAPDGKILYMNASATNALGFTMEEIIGTSVLSHVAEECRADVISKMAARTGEGEVPPYEIDIISRDGRRSSVIVKGTPIRYRNSPAHLLVLTDITERKVAEEALHQANKKLTLLSSITRHDINNQLTVLMSYLTILKKKQSDPSLTEYFQKINTAAQHISSMIQFAREYQCLGIKTPTWQDCRSLTDTAILQVPLGKVMVKNDLPTGAEIFADPLIAKVIYNLIDNAVRYGGKITAIRFSVEEREGDHLVVCEDDGDGVIAEEKEKIFERGFGKNTGLGLALSREILSITGITIRETGEPGKGARFEMVVPKGMWRIERRIT